MKPKYLLGAVGVIIVLFAAIFGIYISMPGTSAPAPVEQKIVAPAQEPAPVPVQEQPQPQASDISLTIQGLYQAKQVPITADETVLQVLQALNTQDPQVQLSTKEYAGLGTLVDGINGVKNGADKKYWQYKVNDVAPQIGADAYKLKAGDTVEWYFDVSQL